MQQTFAVCGVYVVKLIPQHDEALLQYGGVVGREVAEKLVQYLLLLVAEIVHVVEFVHVAYKREHFRGIGKVLVHVVEVGKHQFSPIIELVYGLL